MLSVMYIGPAEIGRVFDEAFRTVTPHALLHNANTCGEAAECVTHRCIPVLPDVVLVDVETQTGSPRELVQQLRECPDLLRTPIVFLVEDAVEDVAVRQAYEAGAAACLPRQLDDDGAATVAGAISKWFAISRRPVRNEPFRLVVRPQASSPRHP